MNNDVYDFAKKHFAKKDCFLTREDFFFVQTKGISHLLPASNSRIKNPHSLDFKKQLMENADASYSTSALHALHSSLISCPKCLDNVLSSYLIVDELLFLKNLLALHMYETKAFFLESTENFLENFLYDMNRSLSGAHYYVKAMLKRKDSSFTLEDVDAVYKNVFYAVVQQCKALSFPDEKQLLFEASVSWLYDYDYYFTKLDEQKQCASWGRVFTIVYTRFTEYFKKTASFYPSKEIISSWLTGAFAPFSNIFSLKEKNAAQNAIKDALAAWQQDLLYFQQYIENKNILVACRADNMYNAGLSHTGGNFFLHAKNIKQVDAYLVFELPKATEYVLNDLGVSCILGDSSTSVTREVIETAICLLDSCLPKDALQAALLTSN